MDFLMSFEMGKKSSPSLVVREQKKKSNLITSEKKNDYTNLQRSWKKTNENWVQSILFSEFFTCFATNLRQG